MSKAKQDGACLRGYHIRDSILELEFRQTLKVKTMANTSVVRKTIWACNHLLFNSVEMNLYIENYLSNKMWYCQYLIFFHLPSKAWFERKYKKLASSRWTENLKHLQENYIVWRVQDCWPLSTPWLFFFTGSRRQSMDVFFLQVKVLI